MSRMAKSEGRRARRRFTDEVKAGADRLVLDEGKSAGAVARDLDPTESGLRNWVARARADRARGKSGALTTVEREELVRLRRENRQLRLERVRSGTPRTVGPYGGAVIPIGPVSPRRRGPRRRGPAPASLAAAGWLARQSGNAILAARRPVTRPWHA
jgi:transposase